MLDRSFSVLLVLGLSCAACNVLEKPRSLREIQPKRFQRDFSLQKYIYFQRAFIKPYTKLFASPKWRQQGAVFLDSLFCFLTDQPSKPTTAQLIDSVQKLGGKTCDEPYLLMWGGYALFKTGDYKGAVEHWDMATKMITPERVKTWPESARFVIMEGLIQALKKVGRAGEVPGAVAAFFHSFQTSLSGGYFAGDDIELALELYAQADLGEADDNKWRELLSIMAKTPNLDPWFENTARGIAFIDIAWDERGGGLGKHLSNEQANGFRKNLLVAKEHLLKAHKLRPDFPRAAQNMITVEMGLSAPKRVIRQWFEKAVEYGFDRTGPYQEYAEMALLPKWGGSHAELKAFAFECMATERYDTIIPLYGLRILRLSAGYEGNEGDWRTLFSDETVQANLDRMFEGVLKSPKWAEDKDRLVTLWAMVKLWARDAERAKELLAKTSRRVGLKDGFIETPISRAGVDWDAIDAEIALLTGPDKDAFQKMEDLMAAESKKDALSACRSLRRSYGGDPKTAKYLAFREAEFRLTGAEISYGPSTPLLNRAVDNGDAEVADLLLRHGAEVDSQNSGGYTALASAAKRGYLVSARILLSHGASPHISLPDGRTPAQLAIDGDWPEILEELLKNGLDANSAVNTGVLLLHHAIHKSHTECSLVLIKSGADITTPSGHERLTPLHLAAMFDPKVVPPLLAKGVSADTKDFREQNPLHAAGVSGNAEAIALLARNKKLLDARDDKGRSPLIFALESKAAAGAKLLIEQGADVRASDKEGKQPIHYAAAIGSDELVALLIAKGADRSAPLADGRTPSVIAESMGFAELAQKLRP